MPSLKQRIDWVDEWEEQTRENRRAARMDRDYYDGKQWTKEELETLRLRNQPPLVKNRIARKINFILGEEIKKRIDPAARPRTPQHEDAARAATDALRYVKDEQQFNKARSAVLKNMLIEGMGGSVKHLEECEGEPGEDGESKTEYKHNLIHVEFDRLIYDPKSRCPDFSDARYKGIVRWADLDDAIADYPDSTDALKAAVQNDTGASVDDTTDDTPRRWSDRKRKRVKIVELYFRMGEDWYRSDFTAGEDLRAPAPTFIKKKKHSVCPLVMASCYVDQEGMRYGVVRNLISPQDEINKRASKALHLINTKQVIGEEGAVPDPQKFQAELAKPDGGYFQIRNGALRDGSIEIMGTGDLAAGHVQMMQEAKQDIDSIGPSSSTIPDMPESSSGRAFIARQQAASQELGPVFDSLRNWDMEVFDLDWLCVTQYWTELKWLRVTDDREETGYRFVALNRPVTRAQRFQELTQKGVPPEKALETAAGEWAPTIMQAVQQQAQTMSQPPAPGAPPTQTDPAALIMQHPAMQEQITHNQVDQMLVDIVLDEAPDTAVLAQEEFQTLSEMAPMLIQTRPDMAPKVGRMLLKASQLPNKKDLLADWDKAPDPQQQQAQQAQQQIQMAGAKAQVEKTQSETQLNAARAQAEQTKVQIAGAKTPSEIERNQAAAMHDAANAGAKTGGYDAPQGAM